MKFTREQLQNTPAHIRQMREENEHLYNINEISRDEYNKYHRLLDKLETACANYRARLARAGM